MPKWEWDNKYNWFGYYGGTNQIHVLMKEFIPNVKGIQVYDYTENNKSGRLHQSFTNLNELCKVLPDVEQFKQEYLKKKIKSI